jgi:hypothetical protein
MSTLLDRVGVSWRSSLRDVLLIVVSILIAFGLDAWWDGRVARGEERSVLVAVREDFRAARLELDSVLARNERDVTTITALLSMNLSRSEQLSPDSAATLLAPAVFGGLTFDPSMGAVQALLSGGLLNQIQNNELAAALAAWPGAIDEIQEDQGFLIETWKDLRDWAARRGLLTSVLPYLRGLEPSASDLSAGEILRELVADDEGRQLLAAQTISLIGLLDELRDVDARLDDLLSLLDEELPAD